MTTTFIYALCEPGTRTVRYIGRTDDPKRRLKQHLRQSIKKERPLGTWLRGLGAQPEMVILREVPIERWEFAEERFIRIARGCGFHLVNANDGGGGPTTHTPEVCAAMSAARKGVSTGPRGPHTPETRAKMSAAKKGVPRGPYTPEHCAAISAAKTGVPRSLESRAAQSARMKGVLKGPHTPEWCAAISAGVLAANARRKEQERAQNFP